MSLFANLKKLAKNLCQPTYQSINQSFSATTILLHMTQMRKELWTRVLFIFNGSSICPLPSFTTEFAQLYQTIHEFVYAFDVLCFHSLLGCSSHPISTVQHGRKLCKKYGWIEVICLFVVTEKCKQKRGGTRAGRSRLLLMFNFFYLYCLSDHPHRTLNPLKTTTFFDAP